MRRFGLVLLFMLTFLTSACVAEADKAEDKSEKATGTEAVSETVVKDEMANTAAANQSPEEAILAKLMELVPGETPSAILKMPVPNWYQVMYGMQVFYMSADARFLVQGDIIDLKERVNFTEQAENVQRKAALKSLKDENTIVFAPEGETKYTINVFTDTDCPYCVKLHREVPELNKAGVKVRYLLYPRAGMGSRAYRTMVSAWCAEDRSEAITKAKSGEPIPMLNCDNPVMDHVGIGHQVGVSGTPAILLEDGTLWPGYKPAPQLLKDLEATLG